MQTLQIKVKDNALDMVMMLLKNLKKGMVEDVSIINNNAEKIMNTEFSPRDFFHVMNESKDEVDHYLSCSRKEWDKTIDKK